MRSEIAMWGKGFLEAESLPEYNFSNRLKYWADVISGKSKTGYTDYKDWRQIKEVFIVAGECLREMDES